MTHSDPPSDDSDRPRGRADRDRLLAELRRRLRDRLPEEDPPPPTGEDVRQWIREALPALDLDDLLALHLLVHTLTEPTPELLRDAVREVLGRFSESPEA